MRPLVLATVALVLLASTLALAHGAWTVVSRSHGVLLEKHRPAGSAWDELRATTHSPLPAAQVYAAVHSPRLDDPHAREYVKRYQVLRETDHDRLVYEQVSAPLVSDRDYTLLIEWRKDSLGRVFEVTFRTDNAHGPPKPHGFVRMEHIHGRWRIEADPAGGSRVEYTVYSDPAGDIPAWLARGKQIETARANVLDTLAYAAAHPLPTPAARAPAPAPPR